MKNNYPQDFRIEIDRLLGEGSSEFWDALKSKQALSGLRVNPLKVKQTSLQSYFPNTFDPISWADDGFRIDPDHKLGKHPFHAAGLYYLQEPSAMAPAQVLNPQPGEMILDLCAAPGGKSTQILSLMKNQGLLVTNDTNPKRAQALIRNVDRWGARNSIITCESPERLANHFGPLFDRVLVDAPCSGEGTFRSDPGEVKKWSLNFCNRCASIQDEILWFAGKLVRPGGTLVYSTCTFNQLENEGSISRFLNKNPDFSIDPILDIPGSSPGIPITGQTQFDLKQSIRIWPHLSLGEGHFISRLKKADNSEPISITHKSLPELNKTQKEAYESFFDQTLKLTHGTSSISPDNNSLTCFGNQLYLIPPESPDLAGLRVLRWGWMLGTIRSDRFIPSPGLAFGLSRDDVQKVIEFPVGDPDLISYMRGSPIPYPGDDNNKKTWLLVTVEGFSLGWGKNSQGRIKSHFPNWLR